MKHADLSDGWFVVNRWGDLAITQGKTKGGNYRVKWADRRRKRWIEPTKVAAATREQVDRADIGHYGGKCCDD